MSLSTIPLLFLALLLPNAAVLMEGTTRTLPTSPPTPTTTPLLPQSTSPSSPSIETQPQLPSSPPPPPPPPSTQPSQASTEATTTSSSSASPSPQPSQASTEEAATSSSSSASPSPPSTTETAATTTSLYSTTELLYWLHHTTPARSTCPESDQIHCGTSDRCTRIRYICDGDNDCGDNTDEAPSLCAVWRNGDCDRNLARCSRLGRTDCVTISNYCSLDDPPCEGNLDMRLCVMLRDGKIQPLYSLRLPTTTPSTTVLPTTHVPIHVMEEMWNDDFEEKLTHTISHPDCKQLYTRVGKLCLSVFFIGNMTWLESRAFCRAIGGDLFTLGDDIAPFTTLVQHLASHGMTADFWVGGRYINDTAGWMWVNDKNITMGSPFWAVRYNEECSTRTTPYLNRTLIANDGACYNYEQAPPPATSRHCVAATYQHYFYLTDENCFSKKSPLCVMPDAEPGKKQAF